MKERSLLLRMMTSAKNEDAGLRAVTRWCDRILASMDVMRTSSTLTHRCKLGAVVYFVFSIHRASQQAYDVQMQQAPGTENLPPAADDQAGCCGFVL
jgi:hypothetical protein